MSELIQISNESAIKEWRETLKEHKQEGKEIFFVCGCGKLYSKKNGIVYDRFGRVFDNKTEHKCVYTPFTTHQDAIHASIMIEDAIRAFELSTKKVYHPEMLSKYYDKIEKFYEKQNIDKG